MGQFTKHESSPCSKPCWFWRRLVTTQVTVASTSIVGKRYCGSQWFDWLDLNTFPEHWIKPDAKLLKVCTVGIWISVFRKYCQQSGKENQEQMYVYKSCYWPINTPLCKNRQNIDRNKTQFWLYVLLKGRFLAQCRRKKNILRNRPLNMHYVMQFKDESVIK